ncbi:hypothetical protein [Aestuariivirga sp.]|uniref:hypothetical protein n=1 Tax=Aestuariivirga sp. TaxID=2650926 RepID=UPI003918ECB3
MTRSSEIALFLLTAVGGLALGVALGILGEVLFARLPDMSVNSGTIAAALPYLAAAAVLGILMVLVVTRHKQRKE